MPFSTETWEKLKEGVTLLRAKKDGATYIITAAFKDAKDRMARRINIIVNAQTDDGMLSQDVGNVVALLMAKHNLPRGIWRRLRPQARLGEHGEFIVVKPPETRLEHDARFIEVRLG